MTTNKKPVNYIDNTKFFEAIVEHKNKLKVWREKAGPVPESKGIPEEVYKGILSNYRDSFGGEPRVSEYLGKCFYDLAENYSHNFNFKNYTFRSEMVMDAVYFCVKYIDTFNPEKTKNPFAYFTTTCHHAFLQRIDKEHKILYSKYKLMDLNELILDEAAREEQVSVKNSNSTVGEASDQYVRELREDFVRKFEEREERLRLKKEEKKREKEKEKLRVSNE